MRNFNLLAVGDVIGNSGVDYVKKILWEIRRKYNIHCAVVNGENSAESNGIDVRSAKALIGGGADMITTGNHVWRRKEIYQFLDANEYIIRPANYPDLCPGKGYNILDIAGYKILFINLLGCVFIDAVLESPFVAAERIFKREKGKYDFAVIDIHAEATSEKLALAKYIDGNPEYRVSAIFGTHTHVQTADEKILKNGAGYITDVGMTGGEDSIIGVKDENIIQKFLTGMPVKFEVEENGIRLEGAIFSLNPDNFKCTEIQRIRV